MLRISVGLERLSLFRSLPQASVRFNSSSSQRPRRFNNKDQQISQIINGPIVQEFVPEFEQKRIIPVHNTYYSENPSHESTMRELNDLLRKYITLPVDNSKIGGWISLDQYKEAGGGLRLKPGEYRSLTALLSRLNRIDSQLMPEEVLNKLQQFSKTSSDEVETKIVKTLDKNGRSKTVGKRKESSAIVQMVKGEGEIIVNGVPLNKFFRKLQDREEILYPLKVVESENEYNIFATVEGGGFSGKAGAIVNGIAKGLIIHNPFLKPRLYKAGCMTRDHRVKERKKPGLRKARKAPTWVKR